MKTYTLFDGSFNHHPYDVIKGPSSLSSFPDYGRWPSNFKWSRDAENLQDTCVFTDHYINTASSINCKRKIAWILEPKELGYFKINDNLEDIFDIIYTHDKELLEKFSSKSRYYFFGGTWIKNEDFKVYEKNKNFSIIASGKRDLKGHKLRHAAIDKFASKYSIDVFGRGYNPVDYKLEALKDYRYSLVIENVDSGILTEKLLDSLLTGTIPIFYGSDKVFNYFEKEAILKFNDLEELSNILSVILENPIEYYNKILPYINKNLELAKKYIICEDNLNFEII